MEEKKWFEKMKEKVVENKNLVISIGAGALTIGVTALVTYLGLKGHGYSEMQPLPGVKEPAATE